MIDLETKEKSTNIVGQCQKERNIFSPDGLPYLFGQSGDINDRASHTEHRAIRDWD